MKTRVLSILLAILMVVTAFALSACDYHEHAWSDWEVIEEADCQHPGTEERFCDCGMTQQKSIPKASHTESGWIVDKKATCLEEGSKYKKCMVCKEELDVNTIPKADHEYSNWIDEVPATIESEGTLGHYTCEVCKKNFDEEKNELATLVIPKLGNDEPVTPPHEHIEGDFIIDKEATCTDEGSGHIECASCGETIKIEVISVDSSNHREGEWITDKNSTCSEEGSKHTECANCGETIKTEVIPVDSSKHNEVIDSAVNATCTETGLTEGKHCSVCQKIILAQEVTSTIEHSYENDICSMCGEVKTSEEYFTFTLLSDGTYSIKAKNVNNMPSNVIIPSKYDGQSVTSIGENAFEGCDSIVSVVIPDSVTFIGVSAFYNCSNLTSVVISDSIACIYYDVFDGTAYYNDASNWVDDVLYIGNHLIEAKETISVEYVVKDGTVTIASCAFTDCCSLTSVIIPQSVTSICDWALNNLSLKSIIVDENNSHYTSIDGNLYTKDEKKLIQYARGREYTKFEVPYGVEIIGDWAIQSNNLINIVIPDSVNLIGDGGISHCNNVTSITIPDNVTSLGKWTFMCCFNITSINIPDNVTSIDEGMFFECYKLKSIVIPNSVTYIGDQAFYNCKSLTDIYYTGTEEEWANISIDSYNSYLTNAIIHYNYVPEE